MIRVFFVLLILLQSLISFSQRNVKKDFVFPDKIKLDKSAYRLKQNKADSIKYCSNDTVLNGLVDPLNHIDNLRFRFIVRELEMNYSKKKTITYK